MPFEMAVRLGGVRSVMNAYQDNDSVPAAAARHLLTDVLRDAWGFEGIVVADYSSIGFLHLLHGVAASKEEAAHLALSAGIDVELPNPDCYPTLVASGPAPELDRAVRRVLDVKESLGLFDQPYVDEAGLERLDLDPPEHRALARRVAERSVILLRNEGGLPPLAPGVSVALPGPNADSVAAVLGNYSFENHVAFHFADGRPAPRSPPSPTACEQ